MDKPHIGLPADEVLKMKDRDYWHAVREPKKIGDLVEWYYPDCTVVLEYKALRWRVKDVRIEKNEGPYSDEYSEERS